MRFKQFKPRKLTEAKLEQLDELRMGPSNLQQFATSNEAKGIMAGFEAELVFTGLGSDEYSDDYDMEPDMDADERCRSIQQVMDFFENDEWGYGVSGRDADKLQEGLDEMYWEWHESAMYDAFRDEAEDLIKKIIEEDDFDWEDETRKQLDMMDLSDDEIEEAMKQGTGAPKFDRSSEQEEYALANPGYQRYLEAREQAEGLLDDLVQDSLSSQDKNYDAALDEFRDSFYIDDDSGFFSDVGLRWMSDVQDQFDLMWPVMTGTGSSNEGGFSEDNAERLADDLHEKLGVRTKVSSGYHSARRDNETWIFEPDSSLDSDDPENMPVEIVSPPMPLEECLRQMENFFAWAETNGAYANESTGFHMGVSLPSKGGDVDYVKLALFLGDEHVLESFGRASNTYTEAAMRKIKKRVRGSPEAVAGALDLMRHNLLELAQKALEISNAGFGKYTSINPQGATTGPDPSKRKGAKYIEFRSAGGTNYFEDIDKLKNTLLRYAQAMYVASRPDLERKEYYKKLYKLISPPDGDPAIDLFARYTSGAIDASQLKSMWAEKQLDREPKGDWVLYDSNGKRVPNQTYSGYTKSEAWERAKQSISPGSSMEGFQKEYKFLPSNSETGDWEVYDPETGETLETLRGFENRGRAADSVYDKYASKGQEFGLRPVAKDEPEKPLSQRQQLAKRIKAPKPNNWNVVYRPTGRVIGQIKGVGREEAQSASLPRIAIEHNLDVNDLELHAVKAELQPNVNQNFSNQQDTSRPPEGFQTQRPSTGDYYEIRGGDDRVYGYLPGPVSGGGMAAADIAIAARRYVNNLTGRDDAYVQYRAGDPVQLTAANGVPMWEVYERDSGHVVHTFADHDQTSAWATGQQWVRSVGAEDPSLFSVRPKMSA